MKRKMHKGLLLILSIFTLSSLHLNGQGMSPEYHLFQGYTFIYMDGTPPEYERSNVNVTWSENAFVFFLGDVSPIMFTGVIEHREKGEYTKYYTYREGDKKSMVMRFIVSGHLEWLAEENDDVPMVFEVDVIYEDAESLNRNISPTIAILRYQDFEVRTLKYIRKSKYEED